MNGEAKTLHRHNPVFSEVLKEDRDQAAVISGNIKLFLTRTDGKPPRYELYNLESDPEEKFPMPVERGGKEASGLKEILDRFIQGRRLERFKGRESDDIPQENLKRLKELGYF